MENSLFIGYVGEPDFHDGLILTVERIEDLVRVRIRCASGKVFVAEFSGVQTVKSNKPEGMTLYGLTEMRTQSPQRRFVFANWDEKDEASLEIDAEKFRVYEDAVAKI
jgi:hypothetical protein